MRQNMPETTETEAPETPTVNRVAFDSAGDDALSFFNRRGWVVLKQPLSNLRVRLIETAWENMTRRLSSDIGVSVSRYLDVISQWRDLWKSDPRFAQALHDIAPPAAAMLGLPGVRLFHDHIICKTENGANGEVPWHQDSMYWPVDRTGLSTWVPVQDAPAEHGCLEVADGSHLWGVAEPVDFMQDEARLPRAARTSLLPVNAGDMVLLHSRTWHRSAPTSQAGARRVAHIALWLPQATRYWPDNADWHPTNAQVTVGKGEVLNDDEFPLFGLPGGGAGNTLENKNPTVTRTGGMFGSTERIEKQVQNLLGSREDSLVDLLSDKNNRNMIVNKIAGQTPLPRGDVSDVVEQLWISAASFAKHRSRNVFCSAYSEWGKLHSMLEHEHD